MDDKRDEMCLDSLLAEIERLTRVYREMQEQVDLLHRLAERRNENLVKLDAENQRLRAALPRDLPDLLEKAAVFAVVQNQPEFMRWFRDAAARIREAQC